MENEEWNIPQTAKLVIGVAKGRKFTMKFEFKTSSLFVKSNGKKDYEPKYIGFSSFGSEQDKWKCANFFVLSRLTFPRLINVFIIS